MLLRSNPRFCPIFRPSGVIGVIFALKKGPSGVIAVIFALKKGPSGVIAVISALKFHLNHKIFGVLKEPSDQKCPIIRKKNGNSIYYQSLIN